MAGITGGKRPGAGRKKKERIDVMDALKKHKVDPAEELLKIAVKALKGIDHVTKEGDVVNCPDYEMARKIYTDILRYSAPTLKAIEVEVTGEKTEQGTQPVNVSIAGI